MFLVSGDEVVMIYIRIQKVIVLLGYETLAVIQESERDSNKEKTSPFHPIHKVK